MMITETLMKMMHPTSDPFNPSYPCTVLSLLGREWHAEYFVGQVMIGCVGTQTTYIRNRAHEACKEALRVDY